jgi:hypothetical protein
MSSSGTELGLSGQAFNDDNVTDIDSAPRQAMTKHTLKQPPVTQRPA